jgi:surfeit locus 1 family protein
MTEPLADPLPHRLASQVMDEAPRRGVLVPTLATVMALAILFALGIWQLERKTWKEGLIAALAERLAAPPVVLPASRDWPGLAAERDEFLRVTATVTFDNDKEGYVFTGGSTLRNDPDEPGYWVFTPARLVDGSRIMVNRGWIPQDRLDPATRQDGEVRGPIDIIGVLRWPEPPGLFTPAGNPEHNLWFSRDSSAIAAAKGLQVAPFYLELESPQPPGGLPHGSRLHPNLPDNHLQYALTWFGIAAVLVGVYGAWLFGRWRRTETV